LYYSAKSRSKPQIFDVAIVEMAYWLVPWMESLPESPGRGRGVIQTYSLDAWCCQPKDQLLEIKGIGSVFQGMETEGILEAIPRFNLPFNISLELNSVTPVLCLEKQNAEE
jgi:hypothetical protein